MDDRFFAYTSPRDPGVYFRRYDAPEGLVPSAPGQADDLTWSWDGRELVYWSGDNLMVVPVTPEGDGLRPGAPRLLFNAKGKDLLTGADYDVAADGRLLMIQNVRGDGAEPKDPGVLVIQNWAGGLAAR